jgi:hypothetical protein
MQMVVVGCLSLTTLTGLFHTPSASASTQDYVTARGIEYAQRIDIKDRFEYRDRDEYFDENNQENRFSYGDNRRTRRICWRLNRSIEYLSRIRESLRNNGEYEEARAVARELREQKYKYQRYCQ